MCQGTGGRLLPCRLLQTLYRRGGRLLLSFGLSLPVFDKRLCIVRFGLWSLLGVVDTGHPCAVGVQGICYRWLSLGYSRGMVEVEMALFVFLLLTGCLALDRSCHQAIDLPRLLFGIARQPV